jgi:hypothetical protein
VGPFGDRLGGIVFQVNMPQSYAQADKKFTPIALAQKQQGIFDTSGHSHG